MIQAVIFDMDGLLIDSEPLWQEAELEVLVKLGVPLTKERCVETTGLRIDEAIAYWHQRYPWAAPSVKEIAEQVLGMVVKAVLQQGEGKPGVKHAVSFFKEKPVKVALASSSAYVLIEAMLERLQLQGAFELFYSAQEEEYGKPHPGVYLSAAKRLRVHPTQCLAIEDSLNGVIAAKAAKMKCIAVPEEHNQKDPRFVIADATLHSLDDINDSVWDRFR